MASARHRRAVERLLRAEVRQIDLANLFLFGRDHSGGNVPTEEIGHFVAHQGNRDNGVSSEVLDTWVNQIRFQMALFDRVDAELGRRVDASRLPKTTRDYLPAAASFVGKKFIRKNANQSVKEATNALTTLSERLVENSDGTWCFPRWVTHQEMAAFRCITSIIVHGVIFKGKELVSGFISVMLANGLLTRGEAARHRDSLSAILQLFAISVMHETTVVTSNGTRVPLSAMSQPDGKLFITATTDVDIGTKTIRVSAPLFEADLDVKKHCHPTILENAIVTGAIELDHDGILVPVS